MSLKLIVANGRELAVYDIAGPIYRFAATAVPIKRNGCLLLEGRGCGVSGFGSWPRRRRTRAEGWRQQAPSRT
jgi:hypothetical protein